MTMNDWKDIYSYEKQALDLLSKDHPHYEEIKDLLSAQVNDQLHDLNHTISRTDRRAS